MRVNSQTLKQGTRRLEQVLLLAGCLGMCYLTFVFARMHRAQAAARVVSVQATGGERSPDELPLSPSALYGSASKTYGSTASRLADGTVIGQLQIPKLGLVAPMIEGITTSDLQRGAGHIPGTALPGGLGTVGIAAHRDTYFRPLRNITPGMQIYVTGPDHSRYEYRVRSADVVTPEQVEVLDVADSPQLTLVTCFPFNYIGSAPQRFVVRAQLVSLESDR